MELFFTFSLSVLSSLLVFRYVYEMVLNSGCSIFESFVGGCLSVIVWLLIFISSYVMAAKK